MKRSIAFLFAALVLGSAAAVAQQLPGDEGRALRTRIEERFDVVPLTDGLALRPKTKLGDVRLIEVSPDGGVAINGEPVTGRELREQLGDDADAVLRLSQLDSDTRLALFAARETAAAPAAEEPVERAEPVEKEPGRTGTAPSRRRSSGDRVRILGDVHVAENESISGQAVAVIGSVRVDGEVGDQVVAVLGSVDLGPNAVVRGDVVSVGGRVRRAEGAQVRGNITDVSLGETGIPVHVDWPGRWRGPYGFGGFSAIPRLIGSVFRLLLLMLLALLAFVIARPTVEAAAHRLSDNPVQATFVGIAAEILIVPTLVLTSIILIIIIIGIPLLLLMPFIVLLLLLMALLGFTGVAATVGAWFRRRTGMGTPGDFGDVALGVVLILLPVLIGRLIGLGGWGLSPIAFLFVAAGLMVEFLAWTAGFGAVLTNAFSRWQARRASRVPVPPPPSA